MLPYNCRTFKSLVVGDTIGVADKMTVTVGARRAEIEALLRLLTGIFQSRAAGAK